MFSILNGLTLACLCLFSVFLENIFTQKNADFSRIRTRIVRKRRVRWPLDRRRHHIIFYVILQLCLLVVISAK